MPAKPDGALTPAQEIFARVLADAIVADLLEATTALSCDRIDLPVGGMLPALDPDLVPVMTTT